jgi:hypothetical protein
MISASWQIEIARKPEDVFDFVADLHNEPKFNPDASNIVKTSEEEIGLGTVYTEDFKRIGLYTTTIDQYERVAKLGFDARNPKCDASVRFRFEPAGESSTSVSCTVELTFKGVQKIFEPLLRGTIRKQIERNRGPMLKAALETGS